jgi:hypothetical protein
MKHNIFSIIAFIFLFIATGCGKEPTPGNNDTGNQDTNLNIEIPADPQPQSTDFSHRIMLLQHTGTACPNCPRLMTSLREIAADPAYAAKYQHVASHSYNTDDPAWSEAAKKISDAFCKAYPELTFNLSGETTGDDTSVATIKRYIDQLHKESADAGIAAAAQVNGNTLSVKVQIKAATENSYRVAAWILEDDIKAQQSSNGALEEWMHTHENALRAFSGSSLNLGIYGEKLGTLKAGETAEKDLTIEIQKDWKVENCKVFILVNSSKDGKFDVANCTICPIGGNVAYQYN